MKDVPGDYYRRLRAVEQRHWWHVGMRRVSAAMLKERLGQRGQRLLDAGCGTGGFLAWAERTGAFSSFAGTDISPEALAFAAELVPRADLRLAPLHDLPFDAGSFDLVTLNDVLQHVDESEVGVGLEEVRRVLAAHGTLFVRTNGGRRARRERPDWRLYDGDALRAALEEAGFRVERMTHANTMLSAWGTLRGRAPKAPTLETCGIPAASPGFVINEVGAAMMRAEAAYLRIGGRLPYGHSIVTLARPVGAGG